MVVNSERLSSRRCVYVVGEPKTCPHTMSISARVFFVNLSGLVTLWHNLIDSIQCESFETFVSSRMSNTEFRISKGCNQQISYGQNVIQLLARANTPLRNSTFIIRRSLFDVLLFTTCLFPNFNFQLPTYEKNFEKLFSHHQL